LNWTVCSANQRPCPRRFMRLPRRNCRTLAHVRSFRTPVRRVPFSLGSGCGNRLDVDAGVRPTRRRTESWSEGDMSSAARRPRPENDEGGYYLLSDGEGETLRQRHHGRDGLFPGGRNERQPAILLEMARASRSFADCCGSGPDGRSAEAVLFRERPLRGGVRGRPGTGGDVLGHPRLSEQPGQHGEDVLRLHDDPWGVVPGEMLRGDPDIHDRPLGRRDKGRCGSTVNGAPSLIR